MAQRSGYDLQRPVIGVTGNDKSFSPSWACIRLAVYLAGGQAVRISIRHSVDRDSLDGLIISGGDDIHPSLYQSEVTPRERYDRARDALEIEHIKHALMHNMPMLGICRGYQLINVICGGSLFIDIRQMRRITSNRNTILPRNQVTLRANSKLAGIFGNSSFKVNSLHRQAIENLGQNMQDVAHDEDRIIQAIETQDDRPVVGVQWHPEYLVYLLTQRRLFRWIVEACKSAKRHAVETDTSDR